ncbi:MAG: glycosyltransferase [bacterium]|nr:glycosyltransferase [bacterium]
MLYFGHTGISKGIDILIAMIPEILQTFPDLQLILNCIPAKRTAEILQGIEEMRADLPLEQAKRLQVWTGMEKEKLRALVGAVDCVIAPSLSEGFGSVHTETLSLGTPLITTAVASLPEVVGGKVVLIPPGDGQAIVDAIRRVRKSDFDPLPVKHFDRELQFEQLWELYERIQR